MRAAIRSSIRIPAGMRLIPVVLILANARHRSVGKKGSNGTNAGIVLTATSLTERQITGLTVYSEGADFADMEILTDVLTEAGISTEGNWTFDKLKPLGQGVVEFGCKIGRLLDAGVTAGFDQLKTLFDSEVTWKLTAPTGRCRRGSYACTVSRNEVHFYNNLYTDWQQSTIRGVAIHQLDHIIHFNCNRGAANCPPIAGKAKRYRFSQFNPIKRYRRFISHFAWGSIDEYWAEAVTGWVYRNAYWETGAPSNIDDTKARPYIVDIFSWVEENLIP